MKPNRFERSYRDTPPLKAGLGREGSNKTKLEKTQGKIPMNCDWCGLLYETQACWAKRTANHFCSHACHGAFKEDKVKKKCGVCGVEFDVTRTQFNRISTCSKACSTVRRKARLGFIGPRVNVQHPEA